MSLGKTVDMLMYTPFISIFEVPKEIRMKLTMDEFFGENGCYIYPDFEKQIEKLNMMIPDDMTGDDWPIKISEMIDSLKEGKNELQAFNNWIENNGDGIFSILGDAGTGKSTFLHHLKWLRKDIKWHILDLKKAVQEIKIYNYSLTIPRSYFSTLHGKILSSIILEIKNLLFIERGNKESHIRNRKNIQLLLQKYKDKILNEIPLEKYSRLYKQLEEIEFDERNEYKELEYCKACAKVIIEYFNETCLKYQRNRDVDAKVLGYALTHLLIVLQCFDDEGRKEIIVFDNIERFIGADEIYNKELTDFLNDMRGFCDNCRNEYIDVESNVNHFSQKYQFVVSMRNTTVRNHIPAESTDFRRHTIDLSSWFAIEAIISAKLDWYERNGIKVIDEKTQKHLEYILNDNGPTRDKTLRGLKPKLDLLFNYNKRLIISFLIEVLESPTASHYLKVAEHFYERKFVDDQVVSYLSFAYRSVIWRSVLDWLRKGELFQKEIFMEYDTLEGQIADTNYVWKLLVVLHHFSMINGGKETESRGTEKYMPFLELIKRVYNEHNDFLSRFYENGFCEERERMARLLFYLNYYNRSENNWFQFIDIQYNIDNANRKNLNTWEDLRDIFIEAGSTNPQSLKIRITTAGKAYLGYVAPSFEFVSCLAGKLPLLCCLPTEKELKEYSAEEQKCMKIINETLAVMSKYIDDFKFQINNVNLLYRRTGDLPGESYVERLVKATFGYLTNFVDCVRRVVVVENPVAEKTKEELIRLIILEAEKLWAKYLPARN